MRVPNHVSLAAVAKEGEAHTTPGERRDIDADHHIINKGKMLLVTAPLHKWPSNVQGIVPYKIGERPALGQDLRIIAFPRSEHANDFFRAAAGVQGGGPADDNPRAIGTVHVNASWEDSKVVLKLNLVQAHYKVGRKPKQLNPSIAAEYEDWREHALGELFDIARTNQLEVHWTRQKKLEKVERKILEIAQAKGAKTDRQDDKIILKFH